MYTNLYVYTAYRQYMSGKLYWRYKKNGKWTWKPVIASSLFEEQLLARMYAQSIRRFRMEGEEE